MNLDPAPRQSKLVYLAIDAGLLLTAFIIVFFAKNPYAPLPFVTAVLCVVLAAIIGFVPFLLEFIVDQREIVAAERAKVVEQAQRLQAATDSLGRAASQIKAVEEAVHKAATNAENLPYRMQEKLAEFNEALATKDNEEREVLERELEELRAANSNNLKGVADKIAKATADWSALEATTRKQLTAAQDASAKLNDELKKSLAQIESRIAELAKAAASVPVAAVHDRRSEPAPAPVVDGGHRPPLQESVLPAVEPATAPVVETVKPIVAEAPPLAPQAEEPAAPSPIESVTLTEIAAAPVEEAKPKKPRAPRKPKPEDTLAAMSAEPAAETSSSAEPTSASAAASSEESPAASVESSVSSDGATRLLVTAYIGIGNKLFIRGDGPGLSWDKGVPMQFVSIGKWGWASHDVATPIACKLYKNDDTAALSGEIFLEPGKHVEVTALF